MRITRKNVYYFYLITLIVVVSMVCFIESITPERGIYIFGFIVILAFALQKIFYHNSEKDE